MRVDLDIQPGSREFRELQHYAKANQIDIDRACSMIISDYLDEYTHRIEGADVGSVTSLEERHRRISVSNSSDKDE